MVGHVNMGLPSTMYTEASSLPAACNTAATITLLLFSEQAYLYCAEHDFCIEVVWNCANELALNRQLNIEQ